MTIQNALTSHQAIEIARQSVSLGRLREAEALYRRIIESQPHFHPAYHGLALVALQVGKLELAAQLLESAIALDATIPVYHRDRGEICRRLGRLDDSIAEGAVATRLAPDDADAHYNLGLALADQHNYAAAIESYQRATDLYPAHGKALNNMGNALEKQGDRTGAMAAYRAAVAIDEAHVEAQNNLGSILSQSGDIDGARACFDKALAADPRSVTSHHNLSTLKKYTRDDPAIAMLEALLDTANTLPLADRTRLLFTLGKVRDDLGDYDRAFAAFAEGNRLHASTLAPNEERAEQQATNIIKYFDTRLFESLRGCGNPDPTPIFIVGMPRSGTTLIEQILATHAQGYGAGELKDLHEVVSEFAGPAARSAFPQWTSSLSASQLRSIGDTYLARLRKLTPVAARITDKMPGNFHYLGLIRLALPNAKIIHAVRNPMDSCLSCYTRLFNDTMDFAYDLRTLGRYYVRYMRLMQHWRSVVPADFVLDVRYEDLVNDVERQTRRMLEHVGLPWDANCLEFYTTDRPVRTASLAQVRQPIYTSSLDGWRRFEKHLTPLLEIVRDFAE